MKYCELFAVGVRLFGVWLLIQGAYYIEAFADVKLYPVSDRARDSAGGYLIYATVDLALAAFFLLWTRVIVNWSYGEEREIVKDEESGVKEVTGRETDEP
jgi:hypothetical protein